MNKDTKINVGILGLGRAGRDIHIEQLRKDPRFHIAAVSDLDVKRSQEIAGELGCRNCATRGEMLAVDEIDLVVVATPNLQHEDDAIAVLAAGKHCVVEKPVAASYAGAWRIVEASARHDRRLFTHHQLLLSDEFVFLKEVISSGILGDIFEIRFNWTSYAWRNDWQTLRKNGGGLLNNHGPHAVSFMLALLDSRVEEILGGARHVKDPGDADDHVHFLLKTENGRFGDLFLSSSCGVTLPKFTILGQFGAIVSEEGGRFKIRYYDPTKLPELTVIDGAAKAENYVTTELTSWVEEIRSVAGGPKAGAFYGHVAAVLLDGAPLAIPLQGVLEVARVMDWCKTGEDPVLPMDAHLERTTPSARGVESEELLPQGA